MMLGQEELIKLFPEHADCIEASGIDLRVDRIFRQIGPGSLIDNQKNLPELEEIEGDIITLEPKTAYSVTMEGKIKIPKGYTMLYLPRSTLLRSFISVHTAVGDPNFYGTLQFLIVNNGEFPFKLKKGERIVQAVVFPVKGSGEYNGSYQEKED